ncbi:MAG: helix-turn-helix transcriptional regulator [Betaproteobacteria bacterium]|nr:helix-turn-helix transcriptional regulator [Betaproteobacteria bacterium]
MSDPSRGEPGKIGNRIRKLRFEHGEMTQEALAQAVGITRQTVIALEAERYAPSLDLAMKLAELFGVGVEEVFFRRGPDGTPLTKISRE